MTYYTANTLDCIWKLPTSKGLVLADLLNILKWVLCVYSSISKNKDGVIQISCVENGHGEGKSAHSGVTQP